jgi:Zn-dependent protease with chaperone function
MNPAPNAYVMGGTRTFLTITSGLLECLEEEEIRAVIAHECGHIACEHVVYHTMAQLLLSSGSRIFGPLAALSSLPIRLALLRWHRRSELSADRAAAVYSRAPGPVVNTMIRLAGGSKAITAQVNIDVYREQAQAYDKLLDSKWDEILQGYAILGANHPFLAVRTREILDWCAGEQFQRLMQALDAQDSGRACAVCGKPMESGWKFCIHCGHAYSSPGPAAEAAEREGVISGT